MKTLWIILAIIATIIIIVIVAKYLSKNNKSEELEKLKGEFLRSDLMFTPVKPEESELVNKLYNMGYCAGYRGRGVAAQRIICKKRKY